MILNHKYLSRNCIINVVYIRYLKKTYNDNDFVLNTICNTGILFSIHHISKFSIHYISEIFLFPHH